MHLHFDIATFIYERKVNFVKHFKASELSKRQNYKLLSGSVIPRPIAFVTSQDKNGKLNAAPFSF